MPKFSQPDNIEVRWENFDLEKRTTRYLLPNRAAPKRHNGVTLNQAKIKGPRRISQEIWLPLRGSETYIKRKPVKLYVVIFSFYSPFVFPNGNEK